MGAPPTAEPAPQAYRQLPTGVLDPYPDAFVEQLTKHPSTVKKLEPAEKRTRSAYSDLRY